MLEYQIIRQIAVCWFFFFRYLANKYKRISFDERVLQDEKKQHMIYTLLFWLPANILTQKKTKKTTYEYEFVKMKFIK